MLNILEAKSSPKTFSLRVSVLENCQYRCSYCLPGSVKPFAHKPSWLNASEYRAVARALRHLPITKVRFTGGEPLLRRDLCEIASAIKEEFPGVLLALTTNGEHLKERATSLRESGITHVTVHIDSLDAQNYRRSMGAGDLGKVLGMLPQMQSIFDEVKINVVLQKGINDHELSDFIRFSIANGIEIRFVELMNTGSARDFVLKHFLSGENAVQIIARSFPVRSVPRREASDPAALFAIDGTNTVFGLIASDTQPFCSDCNRLRLNAEGFLRGCLYEPSGLNLASFVRNNASLEDLKNAVDFAVQGKRSFHPLASRSPHSFSMAEIGG